MMSDFDSRNRHFDRLANTAGLKWLGQNTNHLPPHPAVLDAMRHVIETAEFQAYAPPAGYEELRELIRADLGLPDASVWVTDGAISGLYHVCHTLLRPGDEIIAADPGWKWPLEFARAQGAGIVEVPIYGADCGYTLAPAALERAITPSTRLVYFVDPNNPLGSCASAETIREVCDLARAAGAFILHDCTYRHFADRHTLAYNYYPEGTVLTYSFSKWLGLAGLRVGALVAHPALMERLAASPPNNLGSSVIAQRAAIAGLKIKAEWFPQVQRVQRANQAAIHAAVAGIPGLSIPVYPSQANFLAVDVAGAGIRPEALVAAAAAEGILIRAGAYHTRRFAERFVKCSTTVPTEWVEEFCQRLPQLVERARLDVTTHDVF